MSDASGEGSALAGGHPVASGRGSGSDGRLAITELPNPRLDWAYFFDVDGTLVQIAPVPESVRVLAEMRGIVDWLHAATGGAVALVSGRSIGDLEQVYPGCPMPLSGQHGVEWRDASGVHVASGMDERALTVARERLLPAVARHPGLRLEDKGFSLALHYRQAPTLAAYAHRLMRAARLEAGPEYALQRGKYVVELKPVAADKGMAVRRFMTWPVFAGRTPVFVGDDITDEDGFAAVNALGGHSIKMGRGHTVARWHLRDIAQLMDWLSRAA